MFALVLLPQHLFVQSVVGIVVAESADIIIEVWTNVDRSWHCYNGIENIKRMQVWI